MLSARRLLLVLRNKKDFNHPHNTKSIGMRSGESEEEKNLTSLLEGFVVLNICSSEFHQIMALVLYLDGNHISLIRIICSNVEMLHSSVFTILHYQTSLAQHIPVVRGSKLHQSSILKAEMPN
ncbi:hypothetical protein AVEN_16812-1 [Araneus ventricosus]|uniref:Uncharacterized protein n=1 Tax=Araneus ventricosus TaxID=182803 RepID=A0A4Y2BQ00_ARAVE|nr:hypothetical protein AVEN_16812-1 [Araneus ventricosus]